MFESFYPQFRGISTAIFQHIFLKNICNTYHSLIQLEGEINRAEQLVLAKKLFKFSPGSPRSPSLCLKAHYSRKKNSQVIMGQNRERNEVMKRYRKSIEKDGLHKDLKCNHHYSL